jgi:hypothetical protein
MEKVTDEEYFAQKTMIPSARCGEVLRRHRSDHAHAPDHEKVPITQPDVARDD